MLLFANLQESPRESGGQQPPSRRWFRFGVVLGRLDRGDPCVADRWPQIWWCNCCDKKMWLRMHDLRPNILREIMQLTWQNARSVCEINLNAAELPNSHTQNRPGNPGRSRYPKAEISHALDVSPGTCRRKESERARPRPGVPSHSWESCENPPPPRLRQIAPALGHAGASFLVATRASYSSY